MMSVSLHGRLLEADTRVPIALEILTLSAAIVP